MKSGDALVWPALGSGLFLAGLALAWLMPAAFWPLLWLAPLVLGLALAARFPGVATALWLLVTATGPEIWLADLLHIANPEGLLAAEKGVGLGLTLLCLLRFGPREDWANPGLAFPVMFLGGVLHGFWPGLTLMAAVRSVLGSMAPFTFGFVRLPLSWSRAVIAAVIAAPFVVLLCGLVLAAAGLRPLYAFQDGALRLGASSLPAVLAGFCLTSVYALVLEQVRGARLWHLAVLAGDGAILLATGARGPLALAGIVILISAGFIRTPAWPWASRAPVLLAALLAPSLAILAAPWLGFLRLLTLAEQGDMTSLSHRTLIWPVYERAFAGSPWLGWGTGSGKVVVPVGTLLWKLLGTNAAHNEYLRMAVEGGVVGLGLLIMLFILWWRRGLRTMARPEARFMWLVLLAFAIHSTTDNTLIATTASLTFTWATAVFIRAEREAERSAAGISALSGAHISV